MAIFINSVQIVTEGIVEPVTTSEAKDWMRIEYATDDTMINNLIIASRLHIEKLTGRSLITKQLTTNIETSGIAPGVWMVDLPYGPVVSVVSVSQKSYINNFDLLVVNEDYEVIGGKLWLYSNGIYNVTYNCGYASLPKDLKNDIMTLTAWMYENRGKKMNADPSGVISQFPNWDGLNYHQYKTIVI